jgi:hypothetical protein
VKLARLNSDQDTSGMMLFHYFREVIVIVQEPSNSIPPQTEEDMFAEMEPNMGEVDGCVDCSRKSIYTPMKGE